MYNEQTYGEHDNYESNLKLYSMVHILGILGDIIYAKVILISTWRQVRYHING